MRKYIIIQLVINLQAGKDVECEGINLQVLPTDNKIVMKPWVGCSTHDCCDERLTEVIKMQYGGDQLDL